MLSFVNLAYFYLVILEIVSKFANIIVLTTRG